MLYQPHFLACCPDGVRLNLIPAPDYGMLFAAAEHIAHADDLGWIDAQGAGGKVQVAGAPEIEVQHDWQWLEWGIIRASGLTVSPRDNPYLRIGGAGMPAWRRSAIAGYLRARAQFLVFNEGAAQAQQQAQAQMMAAQREQAEKGRIQSAIILGGNHRGA